MSNRRTRRAARCAREPMPRAQFERELIKVVDGFQTADPSVKAFWDDLSVALGVRAALSTNDGIELLRSEGCADA